MKTQISFSEAKSHLSQCLDDVQFKGKSITIVRHGRPAAVLIPLKKGKKSRSDPRSTMTRERFAEIVRAGSEMKGSALADLREGRNR